MLAYFLNSFPSFEYFSFLLSTGAAGAAGAAVAIFLVFFCQILFSSLFLTNFIKLVSTDGCGLVLGSRVFLDLDSDLEVPLTILDSFWTVLSVMDSVRDSLGDFTLDLLSGSSFLDTSSLKEPDFVTLFPPGPPTWTEDDIFVSFPR